MKINQNIIFVGGIHGVGKGTICKDLASIFDYIHLSASKILKWDELSEAKNKKVKDFDETQDRLIVNLKSIISQKTKYLLDGHFCLLNSNNIPERISQETFCQINPKAIFLVTEKISIINERLIDRDNNNYDLKTLEIFQAMEEKYAEEIASILKIPIVYIESGNTKNAVKFLKKSESSN